MEGPMDNEIYVKNVVLLKSDVNSVRYLIAWIRKITHVEIRSLDELRSGVVYCRIMHKLFPTSVQLSKINFYTDSEDDYMMNFVLLKRIFDKLRIYKDIPLHDLSKGRGHLTFVKWMYKFYQANAIKITVFETRKESSEAIKKPVPILNVFPRISDAVRSRSVLKALPYLEPGEKLPNIVLKSSKEAKVALRDNKYRQVERLILNHKVVSKQLLQQISSIDLNRNELKKKWEIIQNLSLQSFENLLITMHMIDKITNEEE